VFEHQDGCRNKIRVKFSSLIVFIHHSVNDVTFFFISSVSTCVRCSELPVVGTDLFTMQVVIRCLLTAVVHDSFSGEGNVL
jgi:hypothetical protein